MFSFVTRHIRPYVVSLVPSRCKHRSLKENMKIARKFDSMKYRAWQPARKRPKSKDVLITHLNSTLDQTIHPELARNLPEIASEVKSQLLNILRSDDFSLEFSSLAITKIGMSYCNTIHVYWKCGEDSHKQKHIQHRLECLTPKIQEKFNEVFNYPNTLKLEFYEQLTAGVTSEDLIHKEKNIKPNTEALASEGSYRKLQPVHIGYVTDIYGLDRESLVRKLWNCSSSLATFGAQDKTAMNLTPSVTLQVNPYQTIDCNINNKR